MGASSGALLLGSIGHVAKGFVVAAQLSSVVGAWHCVMAQEREAVTTVTHKCNQSVGFHFGC